MAHHDLLPHSSLDRKTPDQVHFDKLFGLSAFFTGLAVGFDAAHVQAIGPGILSLSQLLFIIAAAVVGGVGSVWSPFVGTVILMPADEGRRETGQFKTLRLGLIIAAAIVPMPDGLRGRLSDLGRWWRASGGLRVKAKARPAPPTSPMAR